MLQVNEGNNPTPQQALEPVFLLSLLGVGYVVAGIGVVAGTVMQIMALLLLADEEWKELNIREKVGLILSGATAAALAGLAYLSFVEVDDWTTTAMSRLWFVQSIAGFLGSGFIKAVAKNNIVASIIPALGERK